MAITEQEKRYIVEQRAMGTSFDQIGRQLHRPEGTVRSAFNRAVGASQRYGTSGITMPDASNGESRCKYCGKQFQKTGGGKKRLFCSNRCRNSWSNEKKRRTPYTLVCQHCGLAFISFGNPHKRFCGRQCFADSRKEARNGE